MSTTNPFTGTTVAGTQARQRVAARNQLSEKQHAFLTSLVRDRDASNSPAGTAALVRLFESNELNRAQGSALIDTLLSCPRKRINQPAALTAAGAKITAHQETEDIFQALGGREVAPPGKFALTQPDGHVVFVKVDIPTKGKWVGYVFVKMLLGSPGHWREQRLRGSTAVEWCERIAQDPAGAQALYGRKFQECGRCGSPLSNIRSRAAGYGWTCARYRSWPYPTTEEARRILDELKIDYSDIIDNETED